MVGPAQYPLRTSDPEAWGACYPAPYTPIQLRKKNYRALKLFSKKLKPSCYDTNIIGLIAFLGLFHGHELILGKLPTLRTQFKEWIEN